MVDSKTLKKGTKVKTLYGDIETVLSIPSDVQVITEESARKNAWYHPSKLHLANSAFENGRAKAKAKAILGD
jgi:hypothetical protein